jgi:hypothetical protein
VLSILCANETFHLVSKRQQTKQISLLFRGQSEDERRVTKRSSAVTEGLRLRGGRPLTSRSRAPECQRTKFGFKLGAGDSGLAAGTPALRALNREASRIT